MQYVALFLDHNRPLTKLSQLVIPKTHGVKLTDVPDDELAEAMPVAKKIAAALGAENYNILQNNGRLAHQEVDHVGACFYSSRTAILTATIGSFPRDTETGRDTRPRNWLAIQEG